MSADHIRTTADTLTPGQRFKTNTAQRIWKTVTKVEPLGDGDNIPAPFKGHLLVIHDPGGARGKSKYAACSQLTIAPTAFVYLPAELPKAESTCIHGRPMNEQCMDCSDMLPF